MTISIEFRCRSFVLFRYLCLVIRQHLTVFLVTIMVCWLRSLRVQYYIPLDIDCVEYLLGFRVSQ